MDDGQLQKRLGEVARSAREGLGLTQAEVAARAGLTAPVYGRVERGGMMPSVPTLRRIAQALGVPVDALLDMAPEDVPTSTGDLSPEIRTVVALLRTWPQAKNRMAVELLRVLDRADVPEG